MAIISGTISRPAKSVTVDGPGVGRPRLTTSAATSTNKPDVLCASLSWKSHLCVWFVSHCHVLMDKTTHTLDAHTDTQGEEMQTCRPHGLECFCPSVQPTPSDHKHKTQPAGPSSVASNPLVLRSNILFIDPDAFE